MSDYSQIFALSSRSGLSRPGVNPTRACSRSSRFREVCGSTVRDRPAFPRFSGIATLSQRSVVVRMDVLEPNDEHKFRSDCRARNTARRRTAQWNIRVYCSSYKTFLFEREDGSRISVASEGSSFPELSREILSKVSAFLLRVYNL